ncbi:hypothetical protein BFP76_12455 [Amylibacter kogurei]|uniref:DUF2161 domain-containing phosphodiesterase n=1 Tax=Paramylibacter kogurei TaxID=1889778 RepID=A0A2G5K8F0_9RHOB|nr:DUF2161 family putative PD-(D/E)XK-type phosphodiesterase [Amylibacter kogurei]PIB25811.1 hypothetical protein BFP76_12455 [Amylibacter kogurei]
MKETALYSPIKEFLEDQGYTVKAEVKGCDIVAIRDDEPPVIVELKLSLSLALLLQGVDRQGISDTVYVACPVGKGARWLSAVKDATKLCRRLGLGLISVRLTDGFVQIHTDPAPYRPRKFKKRTSALLKEFHARIGDQNTGGQVGRKIMTAYRQDALRVAQFLGNAGPSRPKDMRNALNAPKVPSILQANYYGWFFRVERGVYDLTDAGQAALVEYAAAIEKFNTKAQ